MSLAPRFSLDGVAIDAVPPSFALHGYGTFTTFVAIDGAVLGWPLHLERLTTAVDACWGHRLDAERLTAIVRDHLREEPGPAAVRVTLFPDQLSITAPDSASGVRVLVSSTPTDLSAEPGPDLAVRTVAHERALPTVKSTALFPLLALRRDARRAGYDDALLCSDGHLLEGTTWSVLVWHDGEVATPAAGVLPSITVAHLAGVVPALGGRLVRRPVVRSELDTARLVLGVNVNHPARAITRVDGQELRVDRDLQSAVAIAYSHLSPTPL